jgi:YVTN family beta-propeller protein
VFVKRLALFSFCLVLSTPLFARHIVKISVDPSPGPLAVNVKTNKVYVVNVTPGGTVDSIDGATNTLLSAIKVGSNPAAVAINQLTNRIYFANISDNTVSVIDGAIDFVTATIPVENGPGSIAVNPRTNRIYVVNFGSNSISVIDGASNQVIATMQASNFPLNTVTVNPQTNRIYVGMLPDNFAAFDGTTNTLLYTIQLAPGAKRPQVGDIQVDSALNRVYIVDRANGQLYVINGADGSTTAIVPLGAAFVMAVNSATHGLLVGTGYDKRLLVLDPNTFAVTTSLPIDFSDGIAVNPVTTEIYLSLLYLKTVTVLNAP